MIKGFFRQSEFCLDFLSVYDHMSVVMKVNKQGKTTLHLSINAEIKRLMNIRMAEEGTEISEVTEKPYRKFLVANKKKARQYLKFKPPAPLYLLGGQSFAFGGGGAWSMW